MILVFDTETTGKADFKAPPEAPHQPRIVQIGAILYDDQWRVRGELNAILNQEGFTIPEEASRIHGITNEVARDCGLHRSGSLMMFNEMAKRATVAVAHNSEFDCFMLSIESHRHNVECSMPGVFCTMHAMTPVCRIPNQYGYSDYKWPRLEEAYKHAFNETFDGAHDAMADVRACARLYRWLLDNEAKNKAEGVMAA